jgi:predicted transcriptional regulator
MPTKCPHTVFVADLAKQLGLDPTTLATRPIGEHFYPALQYALAEAPETAAVLLDFEGVKVIDASFTDEILGKMALRRAHREGILRCVVLQSLGPSVLDNIEITLTSRQVTTDRGLRNCVYPVRGRDGLIKLVGKAEKHVIQTFDLLLSRDSLTARDVAEEWNLDIAAASTRLKVLHNLGLVLRTETRTEQGKEYVYEWPL